MKARRPSDWLTVAEAAAEKGVSVDGIRAACREERLPATKWANQGWMIRRADLKAWKVVGHRPKKEVPKGG
jgi:excisionase family DNA binding protein